MNVSQLFCMIISRLLLWLLVNLCLKQENAKYFLSVMLLLYEKENDNTNDSRFKRCQWFYILYLNFPRRMYQIYIFVLKCLGWEIKWKHRSRAHKMNFKTMNIKIPL